MPNASAGAATTATRKVKVPKQVIGPNQGVMQAFAKSIKRWLDEYNRDFIAKVLERYEQVTAGRVYMDSAASKATSMDAPAPTISGLSLQQAEAIARMDIEQLPIIPARKISYRFVRQMLRHLSVAQRRALEKAGVSKSLIRRTFTVPVIRGQFIAPNTAQKIPAYVEWSTQMITKLSTQSRLKIQNAIAEALEHGKSLSALRADIEKINGMTAERAERVALDQSCKLNNFIQLENCKALGITEGIWIHVPGRFTSRVSHIAMNGKRFDLLTGMYDPEVGTHVHPGELPYCRCVYRPVLPEHILEEQPK